MCLGLEMLGLLARSSFQRDPLPRWRRASFQRESPGWMRMVPTRFMLLGGTPSDGRGAKAGGGETGLRGSSNLGAPGGTVLRTVGM